MSHVSFSSFDATMAKETVLKKEKKGGWSLCVYICPFGVNYFQGKEKKQVGNKTWRN